MKKMPSQGKIQLFTIIVREFFHDKPLGFIMVETIGADREVRPKGLPNDFRLHFLPLILHPTPILARLRHTTDGNHKGGISHVEFSFCGQVAYCQKG